MNDIFTIFRLRDCIDKSDLRLHSVWLRFSALSSRLLPDEHGETESVGENMLHVYQGVSLKSFKIQIDSSLAFLSNHGLRLSSNPLGGNLVGI